MARSPLTLAASVTAALPGAVVVGTSSLTEGTAGRFDAAVIHLDDGREAVVRLPTDDEAASELAAESRALHALTAGVRALLPFRAPDVLGETGSGTARILVTDFVPGYRVEPAHLPKGPGITTAIGGAIAAVHALPASVVRTDGLPVRTPQQVRDDVTRLVDRAEATRRVPDVLVDRWRRALEADELWRFESRVVLGGATSASILLDDDGERVEVTGILDWSGLSVGDPATDLRWLASAPTAADDVYAGYTDAADSVPDALLRERARMYAELEFAKWLVHGDDEGRADVVADAVQLLEALADGVRGDRIVPEAAVDVDAALALIESMPATPGGGDTSMQTDAYDPEMVSLFLAAEREREEAAANAPDFGLDELAEVEDPGATAPIDLAGWAQEQPERREPAQDVTPAADPAPALAAAEDDDDIEDEAARASRAALRRWASRD